MYINGRQGRIQDFEKGAKVCERGGGGGGDSKLVLTRDRKDVAQIFFPCEK